MSVENITLRLYASERERFAVQKIPCFDGIGQKWMEWKLLSNSDKIIEKQFMEDRSLKEASVFDMYKFVMKYAKISYNCEPYRIEIQESGEFQYKD